MGYCANIRGLFEVADASDYQSSVPYESTYEATPDEYRLIDVFDIGTTWEGYSLEQLDSVANTGVQGVYVQNLDYTNYVEVQWYYEIGTMSPSKFGFLFWDANPDAIYDWNLRDIVDSSGCIPGCWVQVTDSSYSGFDGTYLVQDTGTDTIILGQNEDIYKGTDATSELSFQIKNIEGIPPRQWIFFGIRNLVASQGLLFRANTAVCDIAVSFIGT